MSTPAVDDEAPSPQQKLEEQGQSELDNEEKTVEPAHTNTDAGIADTSVTNDTKDDESKDDTDSTFSGDDDDSDSDFSPKEDPEVLLIKATTLKEEGNNHFKNKDFDKAARAYRRGTNALKPLNKQNTGDEQVKSLLVSLQTNLSMMCFKQEKYRQSSQVATKVLQIDQTNVKALYRRAVANRKLGEHDQARSDLKDAYKLDPNNTAVKKELASLKKSMEDSKNAQKASLQKAFAKGSSSLYDDKERAKQRKEEEQRLKKKEQEEKQKKRKADWEDECVKRMARGEDAISFEDWEKELKAQEDALAEQKLKEEKRKKEERRIARAKAREEEAAKEKDVDSDDELTAKELAQLRGYKKTADGRVTSYFTREQSHHEKSLIGDITPKRLETSPTNATSAGTPKQISPTEAETAAKGNPSKWNQAGTWEEKDTTEWCRERLISRLKETKTEISGWSLIAFVKEVKDMTGDASVAIVSGKKRYIFDFHCKVKFEIKDPDTNDVLAEGSLEIPDICSTHHEELEVNFGGWKKSPPEDKRQIVTDCVPALTSEVRESVKLWVVDFNNTY